MAKGEESIPSKPVQITVQHFTMNNQAFLAVSYENFPHWHTYWKNPGDAGIALKNNFLENNKEIFLTEEEWPAPKRFIENGTQWAFGYIASYTLFYRLDKADLNKLSGKTLTLNSTWLVCKHLCIPGQKEITFKIKTGKLEVLTPDLLVPLPESELASRLVNLPKSSPVPDYLTFKLIRGQKEKSLIITYMVNKSTDVSFLNEANLIYPFPSNPFDFEHENLVVKDLALTGIVEINWDGEYSTPPEALPSTGTFIKPHKIKFLFNDPVQRKMIVIEQTFKTFDLKHSDATINTVRPEVLQTTSIKALSPNETAANTNSLFYYLILAFIGGLILNIMPCVLPIISLKLFGLIKYQNESRQKILRHNFFYTLGILSTFMVLASFVLIAKSIGTTVGWGFQLQSPNFIAIMIIVLFIFSLNMFGLFEFSTPGVKEL